MKFITLLFGLLIASSANAQVLYKPYELTGIVNAAYAANDFSAIDKLAAEFRTSKSRSPVHGGWHLSTLYFALDDSIKAACKPGFEERCSKVEENLKRWVTASPRSATAPIALSIAQQTHAYALRGTGYANTVTPKGWEGFHRYTKIAHDTLITHKKSASIDPQWYVEMLTIAIAQQWDAKRHWALYEEAVAREPVFYGTYAATLAYFSPRWGGDMGKMQMFIEDAVQRTTAVEGDAMYARLYTQVAADIGGGFLHEPIGEDIWKKVASAYEGLQKRYPGDWYVNYYAKFACRKGDVDVFITQVRKLNEKPLDEIWPGDFFQKCKDYAAKQRPNTPL